MKVGVSPGGKSAEGREDKVRKREMEEKLELKEGLEYLARTASERGRLQQLLLVEGAT